MTTLEIGFVLFAVCAPAVSALCYRRGLRDGHNAARGKDIGPALKLKHPPRRGGEDPRQSVILSNIERYDGTKKRTKRK